MTLALKIADARYDGYEEGFDKGHEQGAHQKALETAQNFIVEGIAPQIVARCTNLPLETILQLVQEN